MDHKLGIPGICLVGNQTFKFYSTAKLRWQSMRRAFLLRLYKEDKDPQKVEMKLMFQKVEASKRYTVEGWEK